MASRRAQMAADDDVRATFAGAAIAAQELLDRLAAIPPLAPPDARVMAKLVAQVTVAIDIAVAHAALQPACGALVRAVAAHIVEHLALPLEAFAASATRDDVSVLAAAAARASALQVGSDDELAISLERASRGEGVDAITPPLVVGALDMLRTAATAAGARLRELA